MDGRIVIGNLILLFAAYGCQQEIVMIPTKAQIAALEQQVTQAVNQWRISKGKPKLKPNIRLQQLARRYSQDMAQRHFFAHQDPDGRNVGERLLAAGLSHRYAGENLAKMITNAAVDVQEVLCGWLTSSSHRQNLENKSFTETGLGVFYHQGTYYFTQIFFHKAKP